MSTNHTKSGIHGLKTLRPLSRELFEPGLPHQRHSFVQHRVRELEVWRSPSLHILWNQHGSRRRRKGVGERYIQMYVTIFP